MELRIKHFRLMRRWTQEELAHRAGISQEHISNLEKIHREKSPTLETLESIAAALDICPLELLICQCEKCKKRRGE